MNSRSTTDRPRPTSSATVGRVYAALEADEWAAGRLGDVYRRLFEAGGARQASGDGLDHMVYVQPSRARCEIGELARWIEERFGQPVSRVPSRTPVGYISGRYDGWVTLFSMVMHASDDALVRDFQTHVAPLGWADVRAGTKVTSRSGAASTSWLSRLIQGTARDEEPSRAHRREEPEEARGTVHVEETVSATVSPDEREEIRQQARAEAIAEARSLLGRPVLRALPSQTSFSRPSASAPPPPKPRPQGPQSPQARPKPRLLPAASPPPPPPPPPSSRKRAVEEAVERLEMGEDVPDANLRAEAEAFLRAEREAEERETDARLRREVGAIKRDRKAESAWAKSLNAELDALEAEERLAEYLRTHPYGDETAKAADREIARRAAAGEYDAPVPEAHPTDAAHAVTTMARRQGGF